MKTFTEALVGAQLAGNTPTPKQNVFALNGEALSAARALSNRVEALADRLVGPRPDNTNGEKSPEPDGLFSMMESDARFALSRIADANEVLNRIERELP